MRKGAGRFFAAVLLMASALTAPSFLAGAQQAERRTHPSLPAHLHESDPGFQQCVAERDAYAERLQGELHSTGDMLGGQAEIGVMEPPAIHQRQILGLLQGLGGKIVVYPDSFVYADANTVNAHLAESAAMGVDFRAVDVWTMSEGVPIPHFMSTRAVMRQLDLLNSVVAPETAFYQAADYWPKGNGGETPPERGALSITVGYVERVVDEGGGVRYLPGANYPASNESFIDIVVEGVNIPVVWLDADGSLYCGPVSGSSFATPLTALIHAIFAERYPGLPDWMITQAFFENAYPLSGDEAVFLNAGGHAVSQDYGYGVPYWPEVDRALAERYAYYLQRGEFPAAAVQHYTAETLPALGEPVSGFVSPTDGLAHDAILYRIPVDTDINPMQINLHAALLPAQGGAPARSMFDVYIQVPSGLTLQLFNNMPQRDGTDFGMINGNYDNMLYEMEFRAHSSLFMGEDLQNGELKIFVVNRLGGIDNREAAFQLTVSGPTPEMEYPAHPQGFAARMAAQAAGGRGVAG